MASHAVDWQSEFPASCRSGAVAIGNFDGAHRGHAVLIRELVRAARKLNGPAVALTFAPHPLTLLRPDLKLELLTTPEQRADELQRLGVNHVLTLNVRHDLLDLGAAEFFEKVIHGRLQTRALVEGPNFSFGRNREGNLELLAQLCQIAGILLDVVDPVLIDGIEVSSSRIRADLLRGDVTEAARCLGRPYRLLGRVVAGQRRGRTIGFPTANLDEVKTIIPGDGVYAVRVLLADGSAHRGAANVGPNPTFGEKARKIEIHLLDFASDLYGQVITIDFVQRLRDTRIFSGPAPLVKQLHDDVAAVRAIAFFFPGEMP